MTVEELPGRDARREARLRAERVGVGSRGGNVLDHRTPKVVVPRRPVGWPMVGSGPPLATAFRSRSAVLEHVAGQSRVVLAQGQVMSGDGDVGRSQIAARVFAGAGTDLRV